MRCRVKCRPAVRTGGTGGPCGSPALVIPPRGSCGRYFTSTVAPCSSSFALIAAASSFERPLHVPGRAVHQVLGFLQAQAGELAHDLDDLDLLRAGVLEHRRRTRSALPRRGAAPPPAAAGAAAAGAAAMVTLNLVLNASISSASSRTVMLPMASRISSLLSVVCAIVFLLAIAQASSWGVEVRRRLGISSRPRAVCAAPREHRPSCQHAVQRADELPRSATGAQRPARPSICSRDGSAASCLTCAASTAACRRACRP